MSVDSFESFASSFWPSSTPFLNSFDASPSERASLGSFVDPNSDHEVLGTVGTIVRVDATFLVNASLTEIVVVTDAERGKRITIVQPQLGVAFSKTWRGTIGLEVPVLGERRFDARGTLAVFHFL